MEAAKDRIGELEHQLENMKASRTVELHSDRHLHRDK